MAPLAYLIPPISGALAYLYGDSPRIRFHGLQSVVFGVSWPALLYGASVVSSAATQITFVIGIVAWIGSLIATALGLDVRLPVIGAMLARAAGSR